MLDVSVRLVFNLWHFVRDGLLTHSFFPIRKASVCKKCARLQSQLATLEGLKHGGITQEELCGIVLRILRLLTATVTFEYSTPEGGGRPTRKATLHYENVGYLYNIDGKGTEEVYENAKNMEQLNHDLEQRFALPEPGREALLSIVVSILSKKGVLRGVSNAALYPEGILFEGSVCVDYSLASPISHLVEDGTLSR